MHPDVEYIQDLGVSVIHEDFHREALMNKRQVRHQLLCLNLILLEEPPRQQSPHVHNLRCEHHFYTFQDWHH